MSKKANEIKGKKAKIITFWTMIGFITLAFITVLIILFIEIIPIKSYSDIRRDHLTLIKDQMFMQEQSTYYVYIYNSNSSNELSIEKAEELEPIVFNYFNFVKRNSRKASILKIYGFDVNDLENRSCIHDTDSLTRVSSFASFRIKENSLPVLVKVINGTIENSYTTVAAIINELQTATDQVTGSTNLSTIIFPMRRFDIT